MEREWVLAVIGDGLRDKNCYQLYDYQRIFHVILSFFHSPLCDEATQVKLLKIKWFLFHSEQEWHLHFYPKMSIWVCQCKRLPIHSVINVIFEAKKYRDLLNVVVFSWIFQFKRDFKLWCRGLPFLWNAVEDGREKPPGERSKFERLPPFHSCLE